MPPPPAQMTIVPFSSSHLIGRCSKIRVGAGEGTTRRQRSPSGLNAQPYSLAELAGLGLVVAGADELRRVVERGVVGVDLDHRQDRRERHLERQEVAELLLDEVADHPLGLGGEDVERIGLDLRGVRGALEREQSDLRAVAVREHEAVALRDRRQRLGGDADVRALGGGGHRLAAPEQRVAAQGHEHEAGLVRHRPTFSDPRRVPTIRAWRTTSTHGSRTGNRGSTAWRESLAQRRLTAGTCSSCRRRRAIGLVERTGSAPAPGDVLEARRGRRPLRRLARDPLALARRHAALRVPRVYLTRTPKSAVTIVTSSPS